MDLITQAVTLLALIMGMVIGDLLATNVFGRPKKFYLTIIELAVFVIVLVLLTNSVYMMSFQLPVVSLIDFVIGFITVLVSRALSTGAGAISYLPYTDALKKYSKDESTIINTAELLTSQGVEIEDAKKLLAKSGFPKHVIEKVFNTHKFETKPHPLTKKIAELRDKKE